MPFEIRDSRTAFASLSVDIVLASTMRLPPALLLSRSKPDPSLRQGGHQAARTLSTSSLPRNGCMDTAQVG